MIYFNRVIWYALSYHIISLPNVFSMKHRLITHYLLKKTVGLLFLIFFSWVSHAQNLEKQLEAAQWIDSLQTVKDDQERMKIFTRLSDLYRSTDIEKSISFAQKGYALAKANDSEKDLCHFLQLIGTGYVLSSDPAAALTYLEEGFQIAQTTKDSNIAAFHNVLGIVYQYYTDYETAIVHYLESIRLSDSLGIARPGIASRGNLADLHKQRKEYLQALVYLKNVVQLAEENNIMTFKAHAYSLMAFVYIQMGQIKEAQFAVEEALKYSEKEDNNPFVASDAHVSQSIIYRVQSKYKEAIEEANKAKKMAQEVKVRKFEIDASRSLSETYLELEDYTNALIHAYDGLNLAKQNQLKHKELAAYELLHKIYKTAKDYKKALKYKELEIELKEKSYDEDKEKYIALAEKRLALQGEVLKNKQLENEILESEKQLHRSNSFGIAMSFFFILALLCAYLVYRYEYVINYISSFDITDPELLLKARFAQQCAGSFALIYIPILLHHFFFGSPTITLLGFFTELMAISIFLISKKGKIIITFFLMLPFYFIFATAPLFIGEIHSASFGIFAIFLFLNYLAPKFKYQVINGVSGILAFILFFILFHQAEGYMVGNPLGLEIMMATCAGLAIGLTLFYYQQNIKHFREKIWSSNQFLKQIANQNPYIVYAKDLDRKFTFTNNTMELNHGISKEEFKGKKDEDIHPLISDISPFKNDDLNVLTKGATIHVKEELIYDKDGNEKWLETIKKPILDKNLKIVGLLGVGIDITSRKIAEDTIKESEKIYRHLFDNTFDGLMILNKYGEILDFNKGVRQLFLFPDNEDVKGLYLNTLINGIMEKVNFESFLAEEIDDCQLPSRVTGVNYHGQNIYLEIKLLRIIHKNEIQIACALKNITELLILEKKEEEIRNQKLELDTLNKEFVSQAVYTNKKNKLLLEIQLELKNILQTIPMAYKNDLKRLNRKISESYETEDDFYSFRVQFEKTHPGFFDKLLKINPRLTNNDLKIGAYLKLGMSTLDIANLVYIERKSVDMSKYRLKKKLNLEPQKDLNEFIYEI